jgi:Sulfotransferase family
VPEAQELFLAASQLGRAGAMWAAMVERRRAAFAEVDPDRVVVVRYEEFTNDPARLLATICSFLEEPESRPLRRACRWVSPRSIGCHKGRGAAELADFEAYAGATLRKYGYS